MNEVDWVTWDSAAMCNEPHEKSEGQPLVRIDQLSEVGEQNE